MAKLPLIVGLGGINAAGRSSGFHSYKLMIADVLSEDTMQSTWQDLARRMGLSDDGAITDDIITAIKAGTCVRRIDSFDPDNLLYQYKANLNSADDQITFTLRKSKLPNHIPSNWQVDIQGAKAVITVKGDFDALVEGRVAFPVRSEERRVGKECRL